MAKEIRFFRVSVREHGAIGIFYSKVFELEVTITGSYFAMADEAIGLINRLGYEVSHIISHSIRKDCL